MTPERWARIEQVFGEALERPAAERAAFLEEACGADEQLRQDVERLLAEEPKASIRSPVAAMAAMELVPSDRLSQDRLASMIGRAISHYRVEEKLGEGGMGVVYRGRDSHLKRFVALKVLPPDKVADPERKYRFVQEARAASALNHPNIVTVYDIDQSDGIDFIAMEYVEGKTLDKLIGRKGLKLDEALKYAVQIADALAKAHAAGIIHRDLKPGNVMVTADGRAKVLDFGLAKLTEAAAVGAEHSTITAQPPTETGLIVGTVSYMSPEQAEGKKVDARSDIFSFGSLLYEMVTGRKPFRRDTPALTLAAILHLEPPPLPAEIPHDLEKIILRCLRKDPTQRFQHMDDLTVELEELKRASDSGALEAPESPMPKRRRRLLWIAGLALVLAATLIGVWVVRSRTGTSEAEPVAVPLTSYPGTEASPSFSPDGTQVAFQWCPEEPWKNCQIYIKQIGVEPPSQLTDNPAPSGSPAWSPDGRTIAFQRQLSPAKTALILIPQRGGRERVLAELDFSRRIESLAGPHLAWTPDSKWLVSPALDEATPGLAALFLFSVETGEKRRLTTPGRTAAGAARHSTPAFSPDGRSLAFTEERGERIDLYLLRLAEGYLPQGEPERIASDNQRNLSPAWTPDGNEIVFSSGTWGRTGLSRVAASQPTKPRRLAFAGTDASMPAVSRQGNRLAYAVGRDDTNIWRVDLGGAGQRRGIPVKFISSTREEMVPAYSPDGKRIAFASGRSGSLEVWVCESDGSNSVQLTSFGGPGVTGPRWSPGGESIAFHADSGGHWDIYVISANGGAPRRLTTTPGEDKWPYWSRDGKWLYYVSNRAGGQHIWKMPSSGGEAIQITRNPGADVPQESPDGKWLYYQRGYPGPLSVWRMPVEGGEETKVLDSVHRYGLWAVGKAGIYFFFTWPDEQGHSSICLHELATGKTRKLATIERPVWYYITVSPDGRTVLYPQMDETGSDLMLAENFR